MASDQGERYERSWFQPPANYRIPFGDWEFTLFPKAGELRFVPEIHDQGNTQTCVFHALCYGAEMECLSARNAFIHLDAFSFARDYEIKMQRSLVEEVGAGFTRTKVALNLFRNNGVEAHSRDRIRICGSRSYSYLDFDQVMDIISRGHPMMGVIPLCRRFSRLRRKQIYDYDPTDFFATTTFSTHMVCFMGFGMKEGRPYLVFANSHGTRFAQGGYGRVYFDNVFQLNDEEFCLHTVSMNAGAPPVNPPPRQAKSVAWRRDPRVPLDRDEGQSARSPTWPPWFATDAAAPPSATDEDEAAASPELPSPDSFSDGQLKTSAAPGSSSFGDHSDKTELRASAVPSQPTTDLCTSAVPRFSRFGIHGDKAELRASAAPSHEGDKPSFVPLPRGGTLAPTSGTPPRRATQAPGHPGDKPSFVPLPRGATPRPTSGTPPRRATQAPGHPGAYLRVAPPRRRPSSLRRATQPEPQRE